MASRKKDRRNHCNFVVMVAISFLVFLLVYWAFYDIQRINGQELISENISPNGEYTIYAYRNSGGATTGYAVLCTLKNNHTGKKRNMYWNYRCTNANIEWISDQLVSINTVELDVKKDKYDYRHPKRRKLLMAE